MLYTGIQAIKVLAMARGKGRWPYLVRTRHPKTVTAFTFTDELGYRPADFAVGVLVKRHSPFGGFQFIVEGRHVEECTIDVIATPTAELLRKLNSKSNVWRRQNTAIEATREELDNSFRCKRPDPDGNHLVRKDREKAFGKFLGDNNEENERLMAERRAIVAKLVERYAKKERSALMGRATTDKSVASSKQKARNPKSGKRWERRAKK